VVAVDRDGVLVLSAPVATSVWIQGRFGELLARCAQECGRRARLADERERIAISPAVVGSSVLGVQQQEVS
jgi:hypothetical protein